MSDVAWEFVLIFGERAAGIVRREGRGCSCLSDRWMRSSFYVAPVEGLRSVKECVEDYWLKGHDFCGQSVCGYQTRDSWVGRRGNGLPWSCFPRPSYMWGMWRCSLDKRIGPLPLIGVHWLWCLFLGVSDQEGVGQVSWSCQYWFESQNIDVLAVIWGSHLAWLLCIVRSRLGLGHNPVWGRRWWGMGQRVSFGGVLCRTFRHGGHALRWQSLMGIQTLQGLPTL